MIILNAIKVIFLWGILVLIHEGGHFLAATKSGVNVEEFSIGFGPVIYSKMKNNTLYRIGWQEKVKDQIKKEHLTKHLYWKEFL